MREHRLDIDGLRAVAVLAVLANHTGFLAGGLVGVDVFFVISGFLISTIILRELRDRRFSLLDFYARRVKRIFPALIVVVATVWVVGWLLLLPDEFRRLGADILQSSTFTLNFFEHNPFYQGVPILLLDHLWSLGVEEQFYLFWPLLLLLLTRWSRGYVVGIALTIIVSFGLDIVTSYSDPRAAYQLPWTRLWELALGGALAHLQLQGVAAEAEAGPRLRDTGSVLGLVLIALACSWHIDVTRDPGWWALTPCAGALLLIAVGPRAVINRWLLSNRLMVGIGLISYPLYLWHFPLLIAARIPGFGLQIRWELAALAVTFLLSFLTYRYIELPVRTSADKRLLPAALGVAMAVCATMGVLVVHGVFGPRPESIAVSKFAQAALEDWLPASASPLWMRHPESLLVLGEGSQQVLYVGDGTMQQYSARIAQILAEQGPAAPRALFAVRDQCAPGAIDVAETDEPDRAACRRFLHRAFEYAEDPSVDRIVIAACWSCYFLPLGDTLLNGGGRLKAGSEAALDDLQVTIEGLRAAGKQVYLVLDTPIGFAFDPHRMVVRGLLPGLHVEVSTPGRRDVEQIVGPVRARLLQVAQRTGAVAIDPLQFLCDALRCAAVSAEGEPLFRDWKELRPSYVRDHVQFLDATLEAGGHGVSHSQDPRSRFSSFASLSMSSR